jgi:hypothetical protein
MINFVEEKEKRRTNGISTRGAAACVTVTKKGRKSK